MDLSPPNITQPIQIAQLNTQRKKTVITQLLNNQITELDILLIQEPSWSLTGRDPDTGNEIYGPTALQGWNIILPVPASAGARDRPRTLTYYRPRHDFSITLRSDIIENRDIQVLDILQTNQPTVTIINIYNDTPKREECIAHKIQQTAGIIRPHPTIITGDFNMHHALWSREDRDLPHDQLVEDTVNWLAQHGFSLANAKGEITHLARHGGERPSVIDLTFINQEATTQDTLKDWAIDPQLSFDSDHNAIKFTIDQGRTEVDNPFGIKYNIKDVQPDEWVKTFENELAKVEQTLKDLQNTVLPNAEQLDTYTECLTRAIQHATERTAKPNRKSPQSKPWWDNDLKNAAKGVSTARREQQEHQQLLGEYSPAIQAKIRRNRNYFKRLCRHKKKSWVDKILEEATIEDIWKFPNWSKGIRNYPTPPISQGQDLPKATTHQDKCEALRKELYQPPPDLGPQHAPNLVTREIDDIQFEPLTTEEVCEAIHKNSTNTAPGHSQITYQTLKWAWSSRKGQSHIFSLMEKCLQTGYHPKPWRKAIAVALKKPKKPDYSNPRAYRLITLLECLGKVLERIVAKRLTFLAGKLDLVPPNQFGGRSNSSTNDAILTFINDIQSAWNHGKVTTALTFDIKGYFDFVNHNRLLRELRRKKIPLEYTKWTASFLSDREAAICLDGTRGEMKPVQNGIPQGSPVSPILAAFYTAELLEKFKPNPDHTNNNTPSVPTQTSMVMYVDDRKLYVSSNSLETNVILIKLAYQEVESWLTSAGLSADITKREIMHYSRRPKYDCSPSITFLDMDGTTRTVTPERQIRWLGVYFDRKLRFEQHVKQLATRGENTVNGLTMLANTVRGLNQTHLRHLYLACVVPKILYACPAWWNGTSYQTKPLEKVQRRALILICAAFKTSPTTALEIEASIPPIKHQVNLIIKRCAIRFNKLPTTSPIVQRLPDTWRNHSKPTIPPPLPQTPKNSPRTRPKTTLQNIAKFTSPDHERIDPYLNPPWRRIASNFPNRYTISRCVPNQDKQEARNDHTKLIRALKNDNNALYIYTDGSKIKKANFYRVGAGSVLYNKDEEVASGLMGLGGHAEVYDAEMAALAMGASQAAEYTTTHQNITNITFFTDNAAAAAAMDDPRPQAAQFFADKFHNLLRPLLQNKPELSINIAWCPSHCGIKGNERADELAKEATHKESHSPFSVTRANAVRRAKSSTLKLWRQEWKSQPKNGRYATANRIPPSLKPTPHFTQLKNNRELFGRLTQCRTGHSYTGEFRQAFLPHSEDPITCPCDNETIQTREHILRECPKYSLHRKTLRKVSRTITLTTILGTKTGIKALTTFLQKSGAFSRSGTLAPTPQGPILEDEPEVDSDSETPYDPDGD